MHNGACGAAALLIIGGGLGLRVQSCFGAATDAAGFGGGSSLAAPGACTGYSLGFVLLVTHLVFLLGLCCGACAGTTGSLALGWWWTASPPNHGGAAARLALYAGK
jgi:hypothetical protein